MPAYDVEYTMVDSYGREARKTFTTVSDIADETAALAAAAALSTDLKALTMLDVLAYTVKQRVAETDSPDAGANRDEGVTFTLRKENNYKGTIKVPGPINGIFNADGAVDLTNITVTDFIANFLTSGDFTFSDGEQATALVRGKLDK